MAFLARVFFIGSSEARIVSLETLGRVLKESPDAKVDLVDPKSGLPVKSTRIQKNQGRLIVKAENADEEVQVRFDEKGELESVQVDSKSAQAGAAPDGSDQQAASEPAVTSETSQPEPVVSAADSSQPAAGTDFGTIGLIGLGLVGLGLAAGGGGGSSSKKTPAPTGLDLAAEDDSGSSNTDNLTANTSALTISGTAEANARVELFDGATSIGSVTAGADGRFTLDVSLASGIHSITAKATGTGGQVSDASQALTITVDTSAPAAPTALDLSAADDSGTVNNDNLTSQTSGLSISGTAEANAIVELFDGATSLGTVTASANGSFTLDVSLGQGVHSITAKARDAAGNVSLGSAVLTITVDTTEDEATGTLSVTGTAEEGGSLTASLTGASDPDGAINGTTYQWQISTDGTSWTNISGATSATYNLASDQSQVGQFVRVVVTTTDALGGTTTFTGNSSAAIANVNDNPTVATSQTVSTAEDTAKTVTVSGSDVDGDSLTYTAGTASHGTITGGTGGVFTYTPDSNYVGTDSFTVTVSDGNGGTTTQTVDVTVTAVEDEATGTLSVTGTAEEGGSLTASLTGASDPDGAINGTTYQWQISSNGTDWTNIAGATSATYNLASDQSQVGQFVRVVVTTTDALGGTTTFTGNSSAAIANVNDAPTVANAIANQNATQDSAFSFQFASNSFADVDGDSLTYSAELTGGGALPAWLSFNAATRTFSGTPANGDVGTINVTVTADDGNGGTVTDSFALVVANADDEATGTLSVTGTAEEGGSLTASLSGASDPDGAITGTAYQWQISSNGTDWSNISGATSATYNLASDQSQVGQFVRVVVTTTDALGGTTAFTGSSSAAIANVNDAPTDLALSASSINENTVTTGGYKIGDVAITDADTTDNNNVLTVSGTDSALFEIRNGNELFYIGTSPNYEAQSSFNITLTASDGALSYSKDFVIAVGNIDEAGITGATTLAEGSSTALTVKVEGVADGTVISYTLSGTNVTASDISGGLTGTFTVTDGVGTINIAALSDRLTEGSEQLTVTLGGAAAGIPGYNLTITDVSLTPVTVANGGVYTATAGKVDTFIIDANQVITATIIGFEEGDVIEILNSSELIGVSIDNGVFNDGEATIFVSATATINLTSLSSDLFGDEASFEGVYGNNAISYVI